MRCRLSLCVPPMSLRLRAVVGIKTILLSRPECLLRRGPQFPQAPGKRDLPSGAVEPGATHGEALGREAREETRRTVRIAGPVDAGTVCGLPTESGGRVHGVGITLLTVRSRRREPRRSRAGHERFRWVHPPAGRPRQVRPSVRGAGEPMSPTVSHRDRTAREHARSGGSGIRSWAPNCYRCRRFRRRVRARLGGSSPPVLLGEPEP
jgi:ADP-ribose pyrophosphatase YjhB (NUDIX family)